MYSIVIHCAGTTTLNINGLEAAWDAWTYAVELCALSHDNAYAELWDNEAGELIADSSDDDDTDEDW